MMDRFQTLRSTQASLAQRDLVAREAVEEEHARLQHYVEESSNQILQQNNRVAEMQSRLDQIRTRVLEGVSRRAPARRMGGGAVGIGRQTMEQAVREVGWKWEQTFRSCLRASQGEPVSCALFLQ